MIDRRRFLTAAAGAIAAFPARALVPCSGATSGPTIGNPYLPLAAPPDCAANFASQFRLSSAINLPSPTTVCPTSGLVNRQELERKPWHKWHDWEKQRLKKAYWIMTHRSVLCPDDPTGLFYQAQLHRYYCDEQRIHENWAFLPWHRGFIYFHELILGSLVGPDFRLPIWDWDVTGSQMPDIYADVPFAFVNACSRSKILTDEFSPDSIPGWIYSKTFEDFVGGPYPNEGNSPQADQGPHSGVHNAAGPAMKFIETAAADPLFYAHHVNVDRFWWHWQQEFRYQPKLSARWGQQYFHFFDPKGKPACLSAAQLTSLDKLGYFYRPPAIKLHDLETASQTFSLISESRSNLWDFVRLSISWLDKGPLCQFLASFERSLLIGLNGLTDPNHFFDGIFQVFNWSSSQVLRLANVAAEALANIDFSVPVQCYVRIPPNRMAHNAYYDVAIRKAGTIDQPLRIGALWAMGHQTRNFVAGSMSREVLQHILGNLGNVEFVYAPQGSGSAAFQFVETEWSVVYRPSAARGVPTLDQMDIRERLHCYFPV